MIYHLLKDAKKEEEKQKTSWKGLNSFGNTVEQTHHFEQEDTLFEFGFEGQCHPRAKNSFEARHVHIMALLEQ